MLELIKLILEYTKVVPSTFTKHILVFHIYTHYFAETFNLFLCALFSCCGAQIKDIFTTFFTIPKKFVSHLIEKKFVCIEYLLLFSNAQQTELLFTIPT